MMINNGCYKTGCLRSHRLTILILITINKVPYLLPINTFINNIKIYKTQYFDLNNIFVYRDTVVARTKR